MGNAGVFPPISNSTGKCNKMHCMGITSEIVTHTFPLVTFVPLDSCSMVYFITSEICGFLHELSTASEMDRNPSNGESLESWYPYFFRSMRAIFH